MAENGDGSRGRALNAGRSRTADAGVESDGVSGRRFVIGTVFGVLLLWGALYLTFSVWRSAYRERAAFGVERVAKAVGPLAGVTPAPAPGAPAVTPGAWRDAVERTEKMLVTLTAANLLDVPQMSALGDRIAAQVAAATPENARATLAAIWDDAEASAGPVVGRQHPRPAWLPARPD